MDLDNVYEYHGQHAVIFSKDSVSIHTWEDWGLIPSSRHSEPVNGLWNKKVDVSGINGQEDLVRLYPYNAVNSYEKLRSAIRNDNRDYILENFGYDIYQPYNGSLSFIIADQTISYFAKEQEIANFLHNQRVTMRFVDDPSKIFTVRTTVTMTRGDKYSNLSINYSVIND